MSELTELTELDERTDFGLSVPPDGSGFQPNMTSNPAIASRLQADALVGRVAELGSLGHYGALFQIEKKVAAERAL